jgi:hypothetical protein
MGAQATGSKLNGLMVLGLEGARALVVGVGVGVFMLRRETVCSVHGCRSEGRSDVVKEDGLGVHAGLVTLRVSEGTVLGEIDSANKEDENGSKVKTGTVGFVVLFVVLLGHIAMPSMIQATVEVGHVSDASTEGKGYTEVLSVCVVVMTTVLVFSAAVAPRLVVSCGEAAALVSSAKRPKGRQCMCIVDLTWLWSRMRRTVGGWSGSTENNEIYYRSISLSEYFVHLRTRSLAWLSGFNDQPSSRCTFKGYIYISPSSKTYWT